VDWEVHRIASSNRYHASPREILDRWTKEEVMQAHEVLNMYDELNAKAAAKTANASRPRRGRRG
jgi:hypothetical protein